MEKNLHLLAACPSSLKEIVAIFRGPSTRCNGGRV